MHYYSFNIGDYASHTSRLSPMEDLAYRRLLDLYYLNEQPLNGCATEVSREIGLIEHVDSVEYVLSKFFTKDENVFRQKRIDLEIKKYKSNAKNKSKAGKASAKARQAKASKGSAGVEQVLNTTSTGEQLTNNQEPLTNNQEQVTKERKKSLPAEAVDYSVLQMSDNELSELKRIRKANKGGKITQRVANELAKQFLQAAEMGYSFDESLTEWETRGWKSFKSEWMKPKQAGNGLSAITQRNIQNLEGEW